MVAVGVGVAGEIKPPLRHALAESWRIQQAIDHPLERAGRAVRQKGIHLRRRRREAGEVQTHPPDQRVFVGLALGFEPLLFQAGEDEAIHGVPAPARVADLGQGGLLRHLEGPVPLELRATGNPTPQQVSLLLGNMLPGFRGRHDFLRVGGGDAAEQFRGVRLAGHERPLAGLELLKRHIRHVQAQTAFDLGRVRAVAGKAFVRQDRADLRLKVGLAGRLQQARKRQHGGRP